MSGDRSAQPDVIVHAGGDGSVTSRLVQVVAKLTSVQMGPYAVIGGLAVSCRLAQAHRATGDVDTLVESIAALPATGNWSTPPTPIPLGSSSGSAGVVIRRRGARYLRWVRGALRGS